MDGWTTKLVGSYIETNNLRWGEVGGGTVSGIQMKAADSGNFAAASRCEIAVDYTDDLKQRFNRN